MNQKFKIISVLVIFLAIPLTIILAKQVQTYINHAAGPSTTQPVKPVVGIIRWDIYSPSMLIHYRHYLDMIDKPEFQYRWPWFSYKNADNKLELNEDNQSVIDQQILYSSQAGINYWLFDWYNYWWENNNGNPNTSYNEYEAPDSNYRWYHAINHYLQSPYKNRLNYALMVMSGGASMFEKPSDDLTHDMLPTTWRTKAVPAIVNHVKNPTYQKVLNGRPIIYFYSATNLISFFNCGPKNPDTPCSNRSFTNTRNELQYLRDQIQRAGLPNPYLVAITYGDWGTKQTFYTSPTGLAMDAISTYSFSEISTAYAEKPYADLVASNSAFREIAKSVGNKVIPVVNTGWDRHMDPDFGPKIWYDQGTPQQVGANLKAAIDWNKANPTLTESNNVLIYALNEYIEGGWIGPTIEDKGARLNAIADVLGGTHVNLATKDRANSYDDTWQAAWVANAKNILSGGTGKTPGFVLEIGDSITRATPYSDWARQGQGKTTEDSSITDWMKSSAWSNTAYDAGSRNGFYLSSSSTPPDASGSGTRTLTASGGITIQNLITGTGHFLKSPAMPAVTDHTLAKQTIADPAITHNLQIDTLISAFNDAEFAVVMLGTNDVGNVNNISGLTTIIDKLEAAHIVPILSTIPPRATTSANLKLTQQTIDLNNNIINLAKSKNLPLIDFYHEVLARRPDSTWKGTLIGADGVHPTNQGAGFNSTSNPYTPGGDPTINTTGDALLNVGYLLRSWLTVQKIKEIKASVVDSLPTPTHTPTPTPTPTPPSTKLSLSIGIDGIGITSRVPLGGNKNPKDKTRSLGIKIYSAVDNRLAYSTTQSFTFSSASNKFEGVLSLPGSFATGIYNIFVLGTPYLNARYPGSITITKGIQTDLSSSALTLITGDINKTKDSENKLNILDYGLLLSCSVYSSSTASCNLNPDYKKNSDLNNDGKVDQDDFTLFIKELANQEGDILPSP